MAVQLPLKAVQLPLKAALKAAQFLLELGPELLSERLSGGGVGGASDASRKQVRVATHLDVCFACKLLEESIMRRGSLSVAAALRELRESNMFNSSRTF